MKIYKPQRMWHWRIHSKLGKRVRDYLYLWHQPAIKRLIVSGIEFKDVVPNLAGTGGVILLRHRFNDESFDPVSHLQFVPADRLPLLAADDVYRYGDFCWADFGAGISLADLDDHAIAELTSFAHAARPVASAQVPGLSNRFLYFSHDDGWYARIFYNDWNAIDPMLRRLLPRVVREQEAFQTLDLLRSGEGAFWCHGGRAKQCEQTEDIDALQQKFLHRTP